MKMDKVDLGYDPDALRSRGLHLCYRWFTMAFVYFESGYKCMVTGAAIDVEKWIEDADKNMLVHFNHYTSHRRKKTVFRSVQVRLRQEVTHLHVRMQEVRQVNSRKQHIMTIQHSRHALSLKFRNPPRCFPRELKIAINSA